LVGWLTNFKYQTNLKKRIKSFRVRKEEQRNALIELIANCPEKGLFQRQTYFKEDFNYITVRKEERLIVFI